MGWYGGEVIPGRCEDFPCCGHTYGDPTRTELAMSATDIIYYGYEANLHCVVCTRDRFGPGDSQFVTQAHGYGYVETLSDGSTIELDENWVRLNSTDNEGNEVHPAFRSDEAPYRATLCGSCHRVLCTTCGSTQDYNSRSCWNCGTNFSPEHTCELCGETYSEDENEEEWRIEEASDEEAAVMLGVCDHGFIGGIDCKEGCAK